MKPDAQAVSVQSCRHCGSRAPVDAHFCPQCEKILTLGRHGDYFSFFGLPRKLQVDSADLERRFRELSRQFHPDYFYNASPAERLASLERSSYLNDAYRALRHPLERVQYLLALEGMPARDRRAAAAQVPPALLEEYFDLSEALDEVRAAREAGTPVAMLMARLAAVREPLIACRAEHERRLVELSAAWDALIDANAFGPERQQTLERLRQLLIERTYVDNLMMTLEREEAAARELAGETSV